MHVNKLGQQQGDGGREGERGLRARRARKDGGMHACAESLIPRCTRHDIPVFVQSIDICFCYSTALSNDMGYVHMPNLDMHARHYACMHFLEITTASPCNSTLTLQGTTDRTQSGREIYTPSHQCYAKHMVPVKHSNIVAVRHY